MDDLIITGIGALVALYAILVILAVGILALLYVLFRAIISGDIGFVIRGMMFLIIAAGIYVSAGYLLRRCGTI